MWFIGVEGEQETSAPPPKKNPGSSPAHDIAIFHLIIIRLLNYVYISTYLMLIFFVSLR